MNIREEKNIMLCYSLGGKVSQRQRDCVQIQPPHQGVLGDFREGKRPSSDGTTAASSECSGIKSDTVCKVLCSVLEVSL